jgi:outer membrane immunogenic protein
VVALTRDDNHPKIGNSLGWRAAMRFAKQVCFAALLSVVGFVGAASAADLPAPMYTKAPPLPPPLYNWSGFYLGVNIGGSWGHQDTTFAGLTNSLHPDGVIGGGQIGFNWQGNNSPWVFGLEADIQGSGQKADGSFVIPAIVGIVAAPGSSISYEDKLEWFGTVRGRIGYAVGDRGRWLPYVTGGLAYGEGDINGSGTVAGTAVAFNNSKTYVGWTVGGGVEWAFLDQWSAKLEYLYVDFGGGPTIPLTAATAISSGRLTDNIARVGVNYHFH